MAITTKTSDKLLNIADNLAAITDALYDHGYKKEANALAEASSLVNAAGRSLEHQILLYAANAVKDDGNAV